MEQILKDLNENQKKAVIHKNGPLLVIAGAGAGKTRVITYRIAYLIARGIKPENILALTFTNKAANEMKARVVKLLSRLFKTKEAPTISTFHSICSRILRQNSRAVNLPKTFTILDQDDSLKAIKLALKNLGINPRQFQPSKIQSFISNQKANLITKESLLREAGNNFGPKTLALIWIEYEKILQNQKSLDFDNLINKTIELFLKKPKILKKYQEKWRYILIDEFQDTNQAQYFLTKILAQKYRNICVVGDEDQSIYSWRGANFKNVFKFESDWRPKIIFLEKNYRSSQEILKAANFVIANNTLRKPKNLVATRKKKGEIIIFKAKDEVKEAEIVARTTKDLIENGTKPNEIAVLFRANFQSRILEEFFLLYEIPYQVVGIKFFERKEIKDVLAYLKAASNPSDIISVKRIINEPPRGIGEVSLMKHFLNQPLPASRKRKIVNFFNFLREIKKLSKEQPVSKVLSFILKKSGYLNYLKDGSEENEMRINNLQELLKIAKKYNNLSPDLSLERFLEETTLISEQDTIQNKHPTVKIMTVHAAKGLEFNKVFITGLEEGLFPYLQIFADKDKEEEERRLFYVALTRAKEKVFLSFAQSRSFYNGKQINKPSRFLKEIPKNLLQKGGKKLEF